MTDEKHLNIANALDAASGAAHGADARTQKKNFAERLSRELAQLVANGLRKDFKGITPSVDGRGHERQTRTAKGVKKLDVNYSTSDLGLGLGISIKTVTSKDPKTGRFSKNFTRIDNELRAEAKDYHERQPFAVMVAVVFLPDAACFDATEQAPSSFGGAVRQFRYRAGRSGARDEEERFEKIFIGCYRSEDPNRGATWFFDVDAAPPRRGVPREEDRLQFAEMLDRVIRSYELRNSPPFHWADSEEA